MKSCDKCAELCVHMNIVARQCTATGIICLTLLSPLTPLPRMMAKPLLSLFLVISAALIAVTVEAQSKWELPNDNRSMIIILNFITSLIYLCRVLLERSVLPQPWAGVNR